MATGVMVCPACDGELVAVERSGVTIDACRSCRGIWLDRGELDKLLERERGRQDDDDFLREVGGDRGDRGDRGHRGQPQHRKHKRKNLLEELFDF